MFLSHYGCTTPSSEAPEDIPLGQHHTFNIEENTAIEIIKEIIRNIVITGGEPTLQKDLSDVCNIFLDEGFRVTIETNGIIYHRGLERAFMSCSPKLSSSYPNSNLYHAEATIHRRNNSFEEGLRSWMKANNYQVKFVVNEEKDLEEIQGIQQQFDIPPENIYLMPQGITEEQFRNRSKMLWEKCIVYGYNYAPRLHIDIFGNKREI